MKSTKETSLTLEVLEDRVALNGAFSGALGAGAPSLTPFPFNGLTTQVTNSNQTQPGFRNSFASFPVTSFVAAPSFQDQVQSFQNQMQAIQNAQMAALDQVFSEIGSLLQLLNANVNVVI